ncbi:MAG: hypothetical protein ACLRV8_11505 [Blautia hansenii]
MGYKKGKKELGIYYAKTLVSIAEEISAKNAGKEKAGIQKIFSALQRRGGTVRKIWPIWLHTGSTGCRYSHHGTMKNCGQ